MKFKKLIALVALLLASVFILAACGSISSPNISVSKMKRDLNASDKEMIFHYNWIAFNERTIYDSFEITKTLSKDNVVDYYVDISGISYYVEEIGDRFEGSFLVRYEKFKEGWALTRVQSLESY